MFTWPRYQTLSLQSSAQEDVEEQVDRYNFSIALDREQVPQATISQSWAEEKLGTEGSLHPGS